MHGEKRKRKEKENKRNGREGARPSNFSRRTETAARQKFAII